MTETTAVFESQADGRPIDRMEQLCHSAAEASTWDVVHRPSTRGKFGEAVRSARQRLAELEDWIVKNRVKGGETHNSAVDAAKLDLRSARRVLRAALTVVSENPRLIARLPRVIDANGYEEPRIAKAAKSYLRAVEGNFAASTFNAYMRELQKEEPLNVEELWHVAAFLQFALLEWLLDEARALFTTEDTASALAITAQLKSLRDIRFAEWQSLVEPHIVLDRLLMKDPAGAYARMDFESRERYRKRIGDVARHSDCTEMEVAHTVLDLARSGSAETVEDVRMHLRCGHVGYYLIDKGFPRLAAAVEFHPPVLWRARDLVRKDAEDFYVGGNFLLTLLILALAIFPVLQHFSSMIPLVIALAALFAPAMQVAVDFVNQCVTTLFEPNAIPRLDFSKGVPAECSTLVAVPSLLLNEKQTRELVTGLEVRYLANRDAHVHFALLTDLPDSITKPREMDTHPLVELAASLIEELNRKYAADGAGGFMLLHRHRIYNSRQGVWMSWERKRGKLLELNQLLAGDGDAFPIKVGRVEALKEVRYVLTLDSDTQLPRSAAAQLAGAIAHPLNQAVVDPVRRIVIAGYGILQPRVDVAVRSTVRSRLAAIFSGPQGLDIYSRAISNSYQDLFGEAVFTGKGIYEAAVLYQVLNRRFPRNALLSHDLIEGAYARAGLITEVELVDDYPSHYSAYSRRQHRWMRGDWQIVRWMFSRVPDESGRFGPNPISGISRWKIFDNLRRSLVDPSLLALFVAGWLGLPGGPLYWTMVGLCLLFLPTIVQLAFDLARALAVRRRGQLSEVLAGFGRGTVVALLHLVLLFHQTLSAIDAVMRSLIRSYITGKRLLEWETAAQAESETERRAPVDRYLGAMWLTAAALGLVIWLLTRHHDALFYAAPLLLIWALSSFVATWLDRPPRRQRPLPRGEREYLLGHALRIWRYFYQFSTQRHHYLIPDNVEEEGMREAARVSPTNIGLLLNARQAACELGFLTVPEFATLTQRSLDTIEQLEKYRGNLYNWYDSETLKPLDAAVPFVSSVDSGNLVASLYTLHGGTRELLRRPLISPQLFSGLHAYWQIMRATSPSSAPLDRLSMPGLSAPVDAWSEWIPIAEAALQASLRQAAAKSEPTWWLEETRNRVAAIGALLRDYLPWTLPEYRSLRLSLDVSPLRLAPGKAERAGLIEDAARSAERVMEHLAAVPDSPTADPELQRLATQLQSAVSMALKNLHSLSAALVSVADRAGRLAEQTEFAFLLHPGRQVLSIGFDVQAQRVHDACYDMIASEARMATFLAIARGDLPQQSWFKLSREHAYAFGHFVPYSWTGTMFEYMMPGIWMRSYPGTLTARIETECVYAQRRYARRLGIPWGISESGAARKTENGPYHYQAYGVPNIAISMEATAGPVVSPYSTFLALGVDPIAALSNLRRMDREGWVGPCGFYEAADYSQSLREPVVVREWMAHHQGMALLALVNLLRDNAFRRWFNANSAVQAAELLLHEKPLNKSVLRGMHKEFAPIESAA